MTAQSSCATLPNQHYTPKPPNFGLIWNWPGRVVGEEGCQTGNLAATNSSESDLATYNLLSSPSINSPARKYHWITLQPINLHIQPLLTILSIRLGVGWQGGWEMYNKIRVYVLYCSKPLCFAYIKSCQKSSLKCPYFSRKLRTGVRRVIMVPILRLGDLCENTSIGRT